MPITFAPIRTSRREQSTDLIVNLRRNTDNSPSLEMAVSAVAMERVRYIDGDRVVAHFDDGNRSWTLERISSDRTSDGYKVQVRALADGRSSALIRLGCTEQQAGAVMGDHRKMRFDFLEVSGNRAVFVLSE